MHLVIYSNYMCGYYNFPHREEYNRSNGDKENKPYVGCTMSILQLSHIISTFISFTSLSLQAHGSHTTKISNIAGGNNHIIISVTVYHHRYIVYHQHLYACVFI